jgi:hypothetical protein
MVDESMAHFKTAVQDQLAEFLGCRWVALYPTAVEALYELQDSVLGPSYSHQITAFCDERSQQYFLLNTIMGSYPIDRVQRVGPGSHSDFNTANEKGPELLWWESVPYPDISHEDVESTLGNYSEASIRATDVTLSPLVAHYISTDYCFMSDMRGIIGRAGFSCAALIGISQRTGMSSCGAAVSATSLIAIEDALRTARQRERVRINNAVEIESHFRSLNFAGTVSRPNDERAAWMIAIQPWANMHLSRRDSGLINPVLGQDTSSLALVATEIGSSDVAGYILSVGLEPSKVIIDELDRLFIANSR